MALFGQLTKPVKELPLIDVSNPDIVMELLEELAITVSTSQWIKEHEPYHPEASDIHDQANDVYADLLGIFQGKVHDKRINRKVRWAGKAMREHLSRHEGEVQGDVIEHAIKRFLDAYQAFSGCLFGARPRAAGRTGIDLKKRILCVYERLGSLLRRPCS